MRIDDLDSFRNVAGATKHILDTLQIYGLHWNDSVFYQSQHLKSYEAIIQQLSAQALIYPCICTRKSLANSSVYAGRCLGTHIKPDVAHALRIKTTDIKIVFNDTMQGLQTHSLSQQHGDFIVKRKDNIIAYHLAVVIDDYRQNISHVVRGFDLLESTAKQLFLQQTLAYPSPVYCHIPLIIDAQGHKLSKQTCAQPVSSKNPEATLCWLLTVLNQRPPPNLKSTSVDNIVEWAIAHWRPELLKKMRVIQQDIMASG